MLYEHSDDLDFFVVEREKRKRPVNMPDMHYHNYYEIYYLISGKIRYFIGDHVYDVYPGDVVLIPPGTIHKTAKSADSPTDRLLIHFKKDFVEDDELLECFNVPKIPYVNVNNLIGLIEKENAKKDDVFAKKLVRLYTKELLALLSRYTRDNKIEENTEEINTIIHEVTSFINENYMSELSLDFLAAKFALSKSYFSRKFKSGTGICLKDYITVVRIKNAEEMLLNTDLSVTAISGKCGFDNSCYFAAVFKKMKGMQPGKYRKLNRKKNGD